MTDRLDELERGLAEALEQQEATSRILNIMSSSPTDLAAVLNVVAESATRLCKTDGAAIFRRSGDTFAFVAGHFPGAGETWADLIPRAGQPVDIDSVPGRPMVTRRTLHVEDLDAIQESELRAPVGRRLGMRTLLSVPLLRADEAIGVIVIQRKEHRPFSTAHIRLIETFADQAAIAIENTRILHELESERIKSDRLLLNVLPTLIADRLKAGEVLIADAFEQTTVLFADIVDFTGISSRVTPEEMVETLNGVFSDFDTLAAKHGLEKIKTVGDAYMAAGGVPNARPDHAEACAEMALDMRSALRKRIGPSGDAMQLRIGLNTGPVVAGVIGTSKFAYDLWGDAVNTASRMESHGIPDTIQVTESTFQLLRDRYTFTRRGSVDIKGKGLMVTYLLDGRV